MGGRRRAGMVVARPIVRAISVAVVIVAFGNMIALGCALAWLRAVPGDSVNGPMILVLASVGAQFFGAVLALVAWAWAR